MEIYPILTEALHPRSDKGRSSTIADLTVGVFSHVEISSWVNQI